MIVQEGDKRCLGFPRLCLIVGCLLVGTFLEMEESSFFGCFRSGRVTYFEAYGQCLTGERMLKQSSSLLFPKDMTGETEEADLVELELDEN